MSGFKGVMKDGWHPKGKDGHSKESWRGDFKGINQVVRSTTHHSHEINAPLTKNNARPAGWAKARRKNLLRKITFLVH